MKLKVFKSLWGMTGPLDDQIKRIAEAGYDGIEWAVLGGNDGANLRRLLKEYNLEYIAMVFTTDPDHIASFQEQVSNAADFQPITITAHSARDGMSEDEHLSFFTKALEIENKIGIPVAHETHRMRAFYAPWSTARILKALPDVKVNADFSHWCCVCESMLDDYQEEVNLACQRTIHIHGRVGHPEGPQVSDPRTPENQVYVEKHETWWDQILDNHIATGKETVTFTPEFGPPGYMQTLPFTRQPVADLWEVCLYMADRFRKKITDRLGK